ncbi:hypothetical protein QBC33DRAFT_259118 [Phialemonium atrogriseum]|uniref:Secreted protein n=1 Tax=Phialemonium atrogriseum TaxID=1093897 RepID=A0AAJ0C5D8_9PEZI|nr:uncharacterized protein QBC33DRAFT_259118 [Phialemonium atrogriseum]KAK1770275.1 hypothetical protein QBC33DRAFT_259118 [Phialemonium atrogriseum]
MGALSLAFLFLFQTAAHPGNCNPIPSAPSRPISFLLLHLALISSTTLPSNAPTGSALPHRKQWQEKESYTVPAPPVTNHAPTAKHAVYKAHCSILLKTNRWIIQGGR